jgi:hypothetical protein
MFDLTTYEGEIEFGDVRDPRNMRPAEVIELTIDIAPSGDAP